ncbi:MAG: cysteine synthase [Acidobacteria bacterium RIFCSPLOWO2_12_FULL_67_14b]|nr:MAG: cysteine synthase [Acidobacteria bacterium RIFCSPLOWO2_12_FULL_67_14b]
MVDTATLDPALSRRFRSMRRLIGNTPLLVLALRVGGERRTIYAKYESLNLTGSIKDRMALHILQRAYESGLIACGDPIAEATSGNTGISFAAIGRALGHPVTVFMPDWMSAERIALISSFGASVVLVSKADGGFLGSIARADTMKADHPRTFLPHQFSNEANIDAHRSGTGPEIWLQLQGQGLAPDAFVAGVGTGGTVMGVGRFLKLARPSVRVHPLEPAESPTLSTGHKIGHHRIQGISDEFVPPIIHFDELNAVVQANDGDAILMAQLLAQHGLAVGISSGANLIGALRIQKELGPDAVVVTVLCDSNKKYLSTDLLRSEPVKDGYLTPQVEMLGFDAINRVCEMCADPRQ